MRKSRIKHTRVSAARLDLDPTMLEDKDEDGLSDIDDYDGRHKLIETVKGPAGPVHVNCGTQVRAVSGCE